VIKKKGASMFSKLGVERAFLCLFNTMDGKAWFKFGHVSIASFSNKMWTFFISQKFWLHQILSLWSGWLIYSYFKIHTHCTFLMKLQR